MRHSTGVLALTVVAVTACATGYRTKGLLSDFAVTQESEDIFRVHWVGNVYTRGERVADFTLLRSAEIAQEHDFKYFILVERLPGWSIVCFKEKPEVQGPVYEAAFVAHSIRQKYGMKP